MKRLVPAMLLSHLLCGSPGAQPAGLERDVASYFRGLLGKECRVEMEMLRREATVTGVAAPKYYFWVKVRRSESVIWRGAARVCEFEPQCYEVLQSYRDQQLLAQPELAKSTFPALLLGEIERRCGLPEPTAK